MTRSRATIIITVIVILSLASVFWSYEAASAALIAVLAAEVWGG